MTTASSGASSPSSRREASGGARPSRRPRRASRSRSGRPRHERSGKAHDRRNDPRSNHGSASGLALPLLIFAILAGLFWYALHSGRSFAAALAPDRQAGAQLHAAADRRPERRRRRMSRALPRATSRKGEPTIVNVWASWCVAVPRSSIRCCWRCARQPGVRLFGIDYKDDHGLRRGASSAATAIPSPEVGADAGPAASAIDWGVYGVPGDLCESAGDGKIAYPPGRALSPRARSRTRSCRC